MIKTVCSSSLIPPKAIYLLSRARLDQTGALEQRRGMEERVEEGGAGEECPGDAN